MGSPVSPDFTGICSPSPLEGVSSQIWRASKGKQIVWLDMVFNQKEAMEAFQRTCKQVLDSSVMLQQLPSVQLDSSLCCLRISCDFANSHRMLALIFERFPSLSPSSIA